MNGTGSRVPRKSRHGHHHRLLNSARPAVMSTQYCGGDDPEQINEIACALDLKRMAGLYNFRHHTMRFDFFLCENELIVNIEHNNQAADYQCPLRKQAKRKLKRHTS